MDDTSLFDPDGDRWVPTELARGPWDVRHCHGGPVSALLARAVERAESGGVDWQVARLTVELTRPVPVGRPLTLTTDVERPGRKVSLVAAVLTDDGTEVARVRGLRIRRATIELPDDTPVPPDEPMPAPATGRRESPVWADLGMTAFHRDACEHRVIRGGWATPGPIELWIRLRCVVVPDEEPSGVQRVAAAADFGNGVSGALPYDRYLYVNPDLSVHLLRPPVGEWVGMRTASHYGPAGAGLAESALYDTAGRLGRSVQSLFVDGR